MNLFTIGYEGPHRRPIFTSLNAERIGDSRQCPRRAAQPYNRVSRKRFWPTPVALASSISSTSANWAAQNLSATAIAIRGIGRHTRACLAHLGRQSVGLGFLAERVKIERCCLLCFEADPEFCHRRYVAERLATGGSCEVIHLAGQDTDILFPESGQPSPGKC